MPVSEILSLLFSFLGIALVLYACYKFSKFMSKKATNISNTNNIKIIERVAFAQDKGLLIVEVCDKYYLIGFANNNIEILKELDEADLHLKESAEQQNFFTVLNSAFKGITNLNTGGKPENKASFFETFRSAVKQNRMDLKTSDKGDEIDKDNKIEQNADSNKDD